jgi:hypothetical protein
MTSKSNESWRVLTDGESAVFKWLLARPFDGRDELAAQLQSARVSRIDAEGSLQFRVSGPVAKVVTRVPVEGRYFDGSEKFGPAVNLLVHVVAGKLHELEIYKDDGSEILRSPFEIDPTEIEVYAFDPGSGDA